MSVLFLCRDLMFTARVSSFCRDLERPLVIAASTEKLLEELDESSAMILVDLTCQGLELDELIRGVRDQAPAARIVAYAPHVMEDHLRSAVAAGCDDVLTQGQFESQLGNLLRRLV